MATEKNGKGRYPSIVSSFLTFTLRLMSLECKESGGEGMLLLRNERKRRRVKSWS